MDKSASQATLEPVGPIPIGKDKAPLNEKERGEKSEKAVDLTEHLMPLEQLLVVANVSVNASKPIASRGLDEAEVALRIQKYGLNQLSPPKKKHPLVIYLEHLMGLFNIMLIFCGVIAYVILAVQFIGNEVNLYVGAILFFVALANAFVEFYQGQKSQAILESFLNLIPSKCYVIRSGDLVQVSALNLVYGDVVYVKSGDKIPADLCLFWANELKVDNSSLTGEAEPQERSSKNSNENPLEAHNLIFNGTLVVNGEGYGIVVRTGDNTVIGQIASLTGNEKRRDSPMAMEIELFVRMIAGIAAVVSITFLIIGVTARGLGASPALTFAIGVFVAFVPQGLPATVTMLLTIAAKRMATRNVLVKDLQGVETLGAITLLATDKTGTLTRNQMTVAYLWTGLELFYAQAHSASETQNAVPLDTSRQGVLELLYMSTLCSRARFESNLGPIATRPVLGDATEAGLLRNAAQKLDDFDTLSDKFPKVLEVPFNSENKWAMTIHEKKHANGSFTLYLKGAPERVLKICSTFFDGQKAVPLTPEHEAKFNEMYRLMASKGHRVLAFAALALPESGYPAKFEFSKDPVNYPTKELTFYGLVSLEDPPKHGVREAIGHCREAGIKVMMVTGDHPLTAESIGRKINLMLQDTKEKLAEKRKVPIDQVPECDVNAIVIHGEKIDSLTDAEWDNIFSKDEIIFARTSPKHKLQIVKRAQAIGHIVGVTGDGVNDSPALKKADLGIAMNQSGSDVSKEAAAMILIDDNFASTVNGIEEGRLIFQNLKKSIQYTETHITPEVVSALLFVSVPLPSLLNTILILLIDLGFELFIALTFAWDPAENRAGLMKLAPRKPVTVKSIDRVRRQRAEFVAEAIADGRDPELEYKKPFYKSILTVFTSKFWHSKFESNDEETLVDTDLLRYALLEVGLIQAIGCVVTYFFAIWHQFGITPMQMVTYASNWGQKQNEFVLESGQKKKLITDAVQADAVLVGQAAYYIAIMIQQCFNLFCCKARMNYPFGSFMFKNVYTFVGLAGGAAFCMFIVYCPGLNHVLGAASIDPIVWLIPMAFGVFTLVYATLRRAIQRLRNPLKYTGDIQGLDLHPTRWSTGK